MNRTLLVSTPVVQVQRVRPPAQAPQQERQGPFEFVITTVTGNSVSTTTKDAEAALILLKALGSSEDVKSFRIYARSGILTAGHMGQDSAKFPKWTA